jgi:hypothetical protein
MATLVAVSISIPTSLLAHCNMDMSTRATTMAHNGCNMAGMTSYSTDNVDSQTNEHCQNDIDCTCHYNQASDITAEATPTIITKTKLAAVSIIQFIKVEETSTPDFFTDAEVKQQHQPPPIFLLNSSFLN